MALCLYLLTLVCELRLPSLVQHRQAQEDVQVMVATRTKEDARGNFAMKCVFLTGVRPYASSFLVAAADDQAQPRAGT